MEWEDLQRVSTITNLVSGKKEERKEEEWKEDNEDLGCGREIR